MSKIIAFPATPETKARLFNNTMDEEMAAIHAEVDRKCIETYGTCDPEIVGGIILRQLGVLP